MESPLYRVSVRRKNAAQPVDVIIEAPGAYEALQIAKLQYGETSVVSREATPVTETGARPTPPPGLQLRRYPGGLLAHPIYALADFIFARTFRRLDPRTPRGKQVKALITIAVCVGILVVLFAVLFALSALGVFRSD